MKLQSHLLWPAGVRMAEMLEGPEEEGRSGHIAVRGETGGFTSSGLMRSRSSSLTGMRRY